jgi:predicted Fe-S protein YdhL (DUF1289 family)
MSEIESPCNKICAIDPVTGLCVGCARTLVEIETWARLAPEQRRRIMAALPQRRGALVQPPPVATS